MNLNIPSPPTPPLDRIMKDGCTKICKHCGSSVERTGFFGLFGEMLCVNKNCLNSKPKKIYR